MKKSLIALAFAAFAASAQADIRTVWINGEPVMINQIGGSTMITGPGGGTTSCYTTGNITNCY